MVVVVNLKLHKNRDILQAIGVIYAQIDVIDHFAFLHLLFESCEDRMIFVINVTVIIIVIIIVKLFHLNKISAVDVDCIGG